MSAVPRLIQTRTWLRQLQRRTACLTTATFLGASAAYGATYVWDPLLNKAGSDGGGTWDTTTANFALGGVDVAWSNLLTDVAAFGSGGAAGTVTLGPGLKANGINFRAVGSGKYTLAGSSLMLGGTTPTINTSGADAVITAGLDGSGLVVTKSGSFELQLDGATTNLPSLKVTMGTLSTSVSGAGSFGNSTTSLNLSFGAGLKLIGNVTAANPVILNGGAADTVFIGGGTLSGPISLVSGSTSVNASSGTSTFSGVVSGAGNLIKSGTQKLVLSGTNTYSGTTTISSGTLQVGNGGTTGTLGSGAVTNNGVLSINRSDALTIANAISGTGTLVKSGAGTLTLSGVSNYTGITTVSGGTLQLNGSIAGNTTSQMIVAGGATLGGTGIYTGATTGAVTVLGGAAVSPGTATTIGTISMNSISWTSDNATTGMVFNLSPTSATSDVLAITGAFTRGSTAGAYIFDFQGQAMLGATYTLITYGTTSSTSIANLVATDLPAGATGTFSFSGNSLRVTVVPEPSAALLALASGISLLAMRNRRRGLPRLSN